MMPIRKRVAPAKESLPGAMMARTGGKGKRGSDRTEGTTTMILFFPSTDGSASDAHTTTGFRMHRLAECADAAAKLVAVAAELDLRVQVYATREKNLVGETIVWLHTRGSHYAIARCFSTLYQRSEKELAK